MNKKRMTIIGIIGLVVIVLALVVITVADKNNSTNKSPGDKVVSGEIIKENFEVEQGDGMLTDIYKTDTPTEALLNLGIIQSELASKTGEVEKEDVEKIFKRLIDDEYVYPFEGATIKNISYILLTELGYVPKDGPLGIGNRGDFTIDNADNFAREKGIIKYQEIEENVLTYETVKNMVYRTLMSKLADKNYSYIYKFILRYEEGTNLIFQRYFTPEEIEKVKNNQIDEIVSKKIVDIVRDAIEYHIIEIDKHEVKTEVVGLEGVRFYEGNNLLEVGVNTKVTVGEKTFESFSEVYFVVLGNLVRTDDIRIFAGNIAVGAIPLEDGEQRIYDYNDLDIIVKVMKDEQVVREYVIPYIEGDNTIIIENTR